MGILELFENYHEHQENVQKMLENSLDQFTRFIYQFTIVTVAEILIDVVLSLEATVINFIFLGTHARFRCAGASRSQCE